MFHYLTKDLSVPEVHKLLVGGIGPRPEIDFFHIFPVKKIRLGTQMKFNKEIKDDILIEVVISARATFAESEMFRKILTKDIEDGWRKIVVDLEGCSFMDSTFLGTIILGFKAISKLGGSLNLANVR